MSYALHAADGKALRERLVRPDGSVADVEHSEAERAGPSSRPRPRSYPIVVAHRIFNSFGG
jgi:hypothetical protein